MKIYNTLTKKKEEFVPLEKGKIKMYACGPTVYNYFHIGNARPFVFYGVVKNYFEFLGYDVTYAQNITDIDDKIIAKAMEEKSDYKKISKKFIDAFLKDSEALGIDKPDYQPKASEYISNMVSLIKRLEDKGVAYSSNGDVFFSVKDFENYGELSGRKVDDMKMGARIEVNESKKHPADFTLWKASKEGEPWWNSPWGKGRPGWHTECVVMSKDILGEQFDIHGGGIDLVFPHHENEKAQAEADSGKKMANYWMHNGFINIEGEKMSKSLNNFFLARDVLDKYDSETIRMFFLSKHYRSPIDFNKKLMIEAQKGVKKIQESLNFFKYNEIESFVSRKDLMDNYLENFKRAMDDDFNTAIAVSIMFDLSKKINDVKKNYEERLRYGATLFVIARVLGFFKKMGKNTENSGGLEDSLIELLIGYRNDYKQDKNWKMSDKIRDDLKKLGVDLLDTPEGTVFKRVR